MDLKKCENKARMRTCKKATLLRNNGRKEKDYPAMEQWQKIQRMLPTSAVWADNTVILIVWTDNMIILIAFLTQGGLLHTVVHIHAMQIV